MTHRHSPLRIASLLGAATLALATAGMAQAADPKYEKQTAVVCVDGSNATDKTGCEKSGGIKATAAAPATAKAGVAVQTQSAKVNATGQAPTTGVPTKTPAKADPMAK